MTTVQILNDLKGKEFVDQFKLLQKQKFEEENPDSRGDGLDYGPGENTDSPTAFNFKFAINKNNDLIGFGMMLYQNPYSEIISMPPGMAFADIYVMEEHRRKGIGSKLLNSIISYVKEKSCTSLLFNTSLTGGRDFLKSKGGILQSEHTEQRLYFNEIDDDLIENWESISLPDDYNLTLLEEIPKEDIDRFCEIYSDLTNNLTREHNEEKHQTLVTRQKRRMEEEMAKKYDHKWYTLILRNSSNDIVGMTEVYYQPQDPYAIRQNLTGILVDERGNGYGRVLKASMINRIKKEFPEVDYIFTTNDVTNAPMRKINSQLGFKEYRIVSAIRLDI